MRATGIIVEYNPFHNGHKLHLEHAKSSLNKKKFSFNKEVEKEEKNKEETNIVIAVMSGNFLQRGEPAIYDKWTRTEMAIKNGVDIVVELPVFYANQSAEIFAKGGVRILDALKVDNIVFGSESSDLEKLEKIANLQIDEKEFLDEKIKIELDKGISYPNAMNNIIEEVLGEKNILKPNDILGIEYIKAIKKRKSNIKVDLLGRKSVGYHDIDIVGELASATSIRKMISEGRVGEVEKVVPKGTFDLLSNPVYLKDFYKLLRYEILSNYEILKDIADMEIGLENRIFENAVKYDNYEEFYKNIMTRRYTNGRMQRVLTHILLKIDKKIMNKTKKDIGYVKILGFNKNGSRYLKEKKEQIAENIKVLSGLKNVSLILSEEERELLNFEIKCDRIYQIINPYKDRKFPVIK